MDSLQSLPFDCVELDPSVLYSTPPSQPEARHLERIMCTVEMVCVAHPL
jgi:hypothetical protein